METSLSKCLLCQQRKFTTGWSVSVYRGIFPGAHWPITPPPLPNRNFERTCSCSKFKLPIIEGRMGEDWFVSCSLRLPSPPPPSFTQQRVTLVVRAQTETKRRRISLPRLLQKTQTFAVVVYHRLTSGVLQFPGTSVCIAMGLGGCVRAWSG